MTNPECRIALICLGSNEESAWGGALATVRQAILMVAGLSEKPAQSSALYVTPAFPEGAGSDFVNAAMAIFTTLAPADLLEHLHRIEAAAGRERTKRWGQRTLDLDLIAVGDMVMPDHDTHAYWHDLPLQDQLIETPEQLILPHPRMQDRAFVLVPLCDVAPEWRHPLLGRSVAEICADLPLAARAEVTPLTAPDAP